MNELLEPLVSPEFVDPSDGHTDDKRLTETLYAELREIAAAQFRRSSMGKVTLQPTAIVNEALLRMLRADGGAFRSRTHCLARAAVAMRCVLVDYARASHAKKREGKAQQVSLVAGDAAITDQSLDALQMHDLLESFSQLSPRAARVVEMRIYAGMTVDETAEALNVSPRTVKGDWRTAVAWLRARLTEA